MKPKTVYEAAFELHRRFGEGDLLSTRIYGSGRIELRVKRIYCEPHIVRGRINGRTVELYGHKRTAQI